MPAGCDNETKNKHCDPGPHPSSAQHRPSHIKTPQQASACLLSLSWEAQCKQDCNYHKMERFQWAELGSVEPAILVKSLGKYVLVQVKEFPAGQVSDKVYEWGGSIVLKTELASFRLRHASGSCPVSANRWNFLPDDKPSLNIRPV